MSRRKLRETTNYYKTVSYLRHSKESIPLQIFISSERFVTRYYGAELKLIVLFQYSVSFLIDTNKLSYF